MRLSNEEIIEWTNAADVTVSGVVEETEVAELTRHIRSQRREAVMKQIGTTLKRHRDNLKVELGIAQDSLNRVNAKGKYDPEKIATAKAMLAGSGDEIPFGTFIKWGTARGLSTPLVKGAEETLWGDRRTAASPPVYIQRQPHGIELHATLKLLELQDAYSSGVFDKEGDANQEVSEVIALFINDHIEASASQPTED